MTALRTLPHPPRHRAQPPPACRALLAAAALALLCGAPALRAQMMPDAPAQNFRLPIFDEGGRKTLELRGAAGSYAGSDRVDIAGMQLFIFDMLAPGRVETTITSPLASVLLDQLVATGTGRLEAVNAAWRIEGDDWTYTHRESRIEVRNHVRVTFRTQIDSFLK